MESLFIDHIEVSYSHIEIQYWVATNAEKESIIFNIREFENWLLKTKSTAISGYWDGWSPLTNQEPGHQAIERDIIQFFVKKIEALSVEAGLSNYLLSKKKPLTKVTPAKKSGSDSRTA